MSVLAPLTPSDLDAVKVKMATRQHRRLVKKFQAKVAGGWSPTVDQAATFLGLPVQIVMAVASDVAGQHFDYAPGLALVHKPEGVVVS